MDAPTLFAQMTPTPEGIIAQLQRQLHAEFPEVSLATAAAVDTVVEETVRSLWISRVKTFVPVLARREAVDWLRELDRHPQSPAVANRAGRAARADDPPAGPASPRDVLTIADDVLLLSDRDVLPR